MKSYLEHSAWQQLSEGAVPSPRKGSPLSLIAVVFKGMTGCFRSQVTNAKDHLTNSRISMKHVVLISPCCMCAMNLKEGAISCYTVSEH